MNKTVLEFLRDNARSYHDSIALVDAVSKVTYAELYNLVCDTSKDIGKVYDAKSSIVRLDVRKDISSVVLFLGLLAANISVVPVSADEDIDFPYTHWLMFRQTYGADKLSFDRVGDWFSLNCLNNANIPEILYGGKYLNSTSGSSGKKKYCVSDWRKILFNTQAVCKEYALGADCVWLSLFPAHMHFYESFMRGIFNGGKTILLENFELDKISEFISSENVTHIQGTSHQLITLTHRLDRLKTRSVKCVECTGSALSEKSEKLLNTYFSNAVIARAWGSTETTGVCLSSYNCKRANDSNIGNIIWPYSYKLEPIDESYNILFLKGFGNVEFFWIFNKLRTIGEWYNTGDVVSVGDEGQIFFKGRVSGMIKCAGENIYPEEIENAIQKLDNIIDVKVIGINDDLRGEIPVAIIQSKENKLNEHYIKSYLGKFGIPPKFIPKKIYIVQANLPYNLNGKIDINKLRSLINY